MTKSKPAFYQYANCDTCRKAAKWLAAQGLEVDSIPIVERPPTAAQLADLVRRSGKPVKKFFNTSGQSYRALPEKDRLDSLSDDAKIALLAADGKLIKRPIFDDGRTVLVGFSPDEWSAALRR
jgi:arsenate reductase